MSISTAPSPSNHPLLDSTTSPSPTTRTTTTTLQPPSLPKLTIHCHLTILTTSLLLFVTSSASPSPSSEGSSHLSPLGCLTYSLPGKAPVASSTRTATTLSPSSAQNLSTLKPTYINHPDPHVPPQYRRIQPTPQSHSHLSTLPAGLCGVFRWISQHRPRRHRGV